MEQIAHHRSKLVKQGLVRVFKNIKKQNKNKQTKNKHFKSQKYNIKGVFNRKTLRCGSCSFNVLQAHEKESSFNRGLWGRA